MTNRPTDVSSAAWRRSSYSANNGGQCVEVAPADRLVAVRDSKNPGGGILTISSASWTSLTTARH